MIKRNPKRGLTAAGWLALAALLLGIVGTTTASGYAADVPPPGAGGPLSTAGVDGHGGTHRITLITGDVAILHVTADGRQAAWIETPARKGPAPQVYELDGQLHLVPAEAAPYVAAGVLDEKLFNLTLLARHGYDDKAMGELPLLLEKSDAGGPPAVPGGAKKVRELRSAGMVSVAADKAHVRTTWEALRGPREADLDDDAAALAGADRVWLNGRVRATLDESVAQVGAPEAWARGYDGSGVTVAVLDTGYDPNHPDLAGQVVGSQDFTGSPTGTAVDGNGHGTHVAATIAGSGAASDGLRKGVAPGADLLIGKVLDDAGLGFEDQIIAGMEWAADEGADIVNLSLGTDWPTDGTDSMSQAVNRLTAATGTLFVVAAGNAGPMEQTIASPGAADDALTVGAVTKDDVAAWFSSRGPRLGDGAIKPEITAPGVDIVAARAAGTSLGNLLDEHYTALNGTSMATPHVAGAAAILAQQHPDWSAEEIKTRLVSTAKTLDEPVTFQGGGRLDLAAATRGPVSVSDAVFSLGRIPQSSGPLSRVITYTNDSDEPVRVKLTADVTSTGADERDAPALRLSRAVLTVPAHGSTSVVATLQPGTSEPGGYAGRVVAQPLGNPGKRGATVHTVLAFVIDGPPHTVTVDAIDRDGQPASGPVDLWSAETGEWQRGFLQDGTATFEVPEGLYSLVASIEANGDWFESTKHTIAGEPELNVRTDVTLHFDARDAKPLQVDTPREAERDRFDLMWRRSVGDRSMSMIITQGFRPEERVYLLRSRPVRTGTFTFASQWQLSQPLLVARVSGSDGFRVASATFASPPRAYAGNETLRLIDAGSGSTEEFAQVAAAGAIALVGRGSEWGELAQQAEHAAAAGAKLLFAYNTSDEPWGEQVWDSPLPVYTLDQETGSALLEALAANPDLTVDLAGVRDATYQYYLAFAEERRIPRGTTYDVSEDSLAAVTSDYRQNSDRMIGSESWIPYFDDLGVGNSMATTRNGPVVRTDYVTTEGVEWQRFGQPHPLLGLYWTFSDPERYEPGRSYDQIWWGPLVHPAVPPTAGAEEQAVLGGVGAPVVRVRDAIRVDIPHYYYGGTLRGTIFEQMGDRSELALSRAGQVIGKSTWPLAQFTVPPDDGEYELRLDVVNGDGNWSDTSVRTETAWRFRSARSDQDRTVLPLIQVRYELDTDAYNAVPAGRSYELRLHPGYQPTASGVGGFTGTVDVSFDDGDTWIAAPVVDADGVLEAVIPAAQGPGFASVRVVITDADGNQLTQRIDRAWRIGEP